MGTSEVAEAGDSDNTREYMFSIAGAALGAIVGYQVGSMVAVPGPAVEALGCGLGWSIGKAAINDLTQAKIMKAVQDVQSVGIVAAMYFGLTLLPMQGILSGMPGMQGVVLRGAAAGGIASYTAKNY